MKYYNEQLCERAMGVAGGDIHQIISECHSYRVAARYLDEFPEDSAFVKLHLENGERLLRAFVNLKSSNPAATLQKAKECLKRE